MRKSFLFRYVRFFHEVLLFLDFHPPPKTLLESVKSISTLEIFCQPSMTNFFLNNKNIKYRQAPITHHTLRDR
jgi:hypothetical protein